MAPSATKKATGTKATPATGAAAGKTPRAAGKAAATNAKPKATPGAAVAAEKAAPQRAAPVKRAATAKKPAATKAAGAKAPVKKVAPAKTATTKAAAAKAAPAKTALPKAPAEKKPARKKTVICPLSGFEITPSSAGLSPKTKERLKGKLRDEKSRLLHQADELVAEAEELARDREAGDTQFDEESGEGDTIAVERERDLLLSAQARHVVEEIDAALLRLRRGTYGVCSYAGRKIPLERLEAIPWADVCVDCKARAERRR